MWLWWRLIYDIYWVKKTLNILQSELQDRGGLGGDLLHVKQSSYRDRNLQDLSAFSEKKYAGCAVSFGSKNKEMCHLIRKRQISEQFCFREEEKIVMLFHQFDLMSVLIKERKKNLPPTFFILLNFAQLKSSYMCQKKMNSNITKHFPVWALFSTEELPSQRCAGCGAPPS